MMGPWCRSNPRGPSTPTTRSTCGTTASSPGRGSAISCSPRATHAIRLEETKHVDRLYFPVDDVHWEHFEPSLNFTICPFKGARRPTGRSPRSIRSRRTSCGPTRRRSTRSRASRATSRFYQERVRIELEEHWPGDDPGVAITSRFPAWGDAADLLRLIDVTPGGEPDTSSARRTATPRATSSRAARCSRRVSSRRRRCCPASG